VAISRHYIYSKEKLQEPINTQISKEISEVVEENFWASVTGIPAKNDKQSKGDKEARNRDSYEDLQKVPE
jgi:hypothetical protein